MKESGISLACIYGVAGIGPASVFVTIGLAGRDSGLLSGAAVDSKMSDATDMLHVG
jgi:hypothetical protein